MKGLSILKLPFAFFRFHSILVLFDHGSFCSKRNKVIHFCWTKVDRFFGLRLENEGKRLLRRLASHLHCRLETRLTFHFGLHSTHSTLLGCGTSALIGGNLTNGSDVMNTTPHRVYVRREGREG